MAVATTANIAAIPIFNQRWPNECPKMLLQEFDFSAADEYTLNLLLIIDQAKIEGVQACYYDNISNNARVTMDVAGVGFRTQFAPRGFGNRTLIMPESPEIKLTCAGGNGVFRLLLTNTPLMPFDQIGA